MRQSAAAAGATRAMERSRGVSAATFLVPALEVVKKSEGQQSQGGGVARGNIVDGAQQ